MTCVWVVRQVKNMLQRQKGTCAREGSERQLPPPPKKKWLSSVESYSFLSSDPDPGPAPLQRTLYRFPE